MNRIFRLDLYADDWPSFHVLVSAIGIQIRFFRNIRNSQLADCIFCQTGELCRAAPIVSIPADGEEGQDLDSMHIGTRETGLILRLSI